MCVGRQREGDEGERGQVAHLYTVCALVSQSTVCAVFALVY